MRAHRAAWVASLLAIVVACGSSGDSSESGPGTSGSVDGGGPPKGDAGNAVDAAGGSDSSTKTDGAAGERIPTVSAGASRITPTEITQKQYQAFLTDVGGTNVAQLSACSWNTTFAPANGTGCAFDASGTPNRPVRCVDWCDARAFCEWAGLRLCPKSQWSAACGGPTNTPYPYGASFNQASCHFNAPNGPPVDVGSLSTCEGGYPGVFDMLGNVGEWEDSCAGSSGAGDQCGIRGGDYSSAGDTITCAASTLAARDDTSPKVGIRCCSK